MSIFENNINVLKESNPWLANQLCLVEDSFDYIKTIDSPIGHKVLFVKNEKGNFLQYNSLYDPFEEAEYFTSGFEKDYLRRIFVIIGMGLGYTLKSIKKKLNDKSLILIVEKDINLIKEALMHVDLTQELSEIRISFLVGQFDEVKEFIQKYLSSYFLNMKHMKIYTLPIIDLEYIDYAKKVLNLIENSRSSKIFEMGNWIEDTFKGISNNFKNIHELINNCGIYEFLDNYKGEYVNKPAIVVASGPSLNKNIDLLKEIQDKALILACDGSLKPLLERNIIPHAVLSVERVMTTYNLFYKDVEIPESVVLIAPAVVRPPIFDKFKSDRKIVTLKKNEGINEWISVALPHKGKIMTASSVAHLCYNFASVVGANPIILVGQDLAYSPDGHSHGAGVSGSRVIDLKTHKGKVFVEGQDGNMIKSTAVWRNFLIHLEQCIKNSNSKCIDATEGGAKKEGSEIMTLKEAISKYCKDEIYPLHSIVERYSTNLEQRKLGYKKVEKLIKNELKWFELILKRKKHIKKKMLEIFSNKKKFTRTDKGIDVIFDTLMYIEKKIVKKIMREFVAGMLLQSEIREIAYKVSELGNNQTQIDGEMLIKNLEIQNDLLRVVEDVAVRALEVLSESLKIVTKEKQELHEGEVLCLKTRQSL